MQEKDTLTRNVLTQEELIKAIKANDEGILKNLYQENFYKTEKYVLGNSGTVDQAKDFYQEAFIAIWENIQNNRFVPQNATALNGYIYTVAKNKWLDYLKSAKFKKTESIARSEYKIESTDVIDQELVEKENKITQVTINFNRMGDACKKILELFYYENESLKEIASQLNITEASARNKKYRCLETLRGLVLTSK